LVYYIVSIRVVFGAFQVQVEFFQTSSLHCLHSCQHLKAVSPELTPGHHLCPSTQTVEAPKSSPKGLRDHISSSNRDGVDANKIKTAATSAVDELKKD
jgi:hypothetical protein